MIRSTITANELAAVLGVSTWALYQSVREGTCPVEPIRVGRRLVWSSARVADLLGTNSLVDWIGGDPEQGRTVPDDHDGQPASAVGDGVTTRKTSLEVEPWL